MNMCPRRNKFYLHTREITILNVSFSPATLYTYMYLSSISSAIAMEMLECITVWKLVVGNNFSIAGEKVQCTHGVVNICILNAIH